jgi:hypothetical protein
MATTFNITPTISGKSSLKFNKTISKSNTNKISEDRKNSMKALVNSVLSNKSK